MNLTLHIDRLVLHDLPLTPGDHRRLRLAVETHLAHLFAATTPVVATPGRRSGDLAHEIARSVHQEIAGGDSGGPNRLAEVPER